MNLFRNCKRFGTDRSGATAVEFAFIAVPLIMTIITIVEFSVLMISKASIDHAGLELHRAVRTGDANASNYRQIYCDAGKLNRSTCGSQNLVVNVSELTQNTGSVLGNLSDGFTVPSGRPFIIRARYEHSFMLTALNGAAPDDVLRSYQVLFGELE